jgi:hypothetical protein
MKKYPLFYLPAFLLLFSTFFSTQVKAQFNTPIINGAIAAGEYGNHTNGQNQETSGSTITYITWDATNLYIAVSAANTGEGFVMYIDSDNLTPIDGGNNGNGTNIGNNYDGTNFAQLPFRADMVMYVKAGYREYRTANGSGGWSSQTTGFGNYADAGGSVREFSIPWAAFPGGVKPTAFNWFSYVTSIGGFVYGQLPSVNSSGTIGTSARYARYYNLTNTGTGTSTKPMSRNCYVFNSATDEVGFGTISVYDFTMNTAGRFISRTGATTNNWTIGGNLVCGSGTIYFGSGGTNGSYGTTTVGGNLDIRGGTVDMDQTTSSLDVNGDLSLSSGTLKLSSNAFGGGDLKIKGNWSNTGGTFTPSGRATFFNSTTSNQSISKSGTETFNYFFVDKGATVLSLSTAIQINNTLNLTGGSLSINGQTLTINGAVTGSGTLTGSSTSNLTIGGTAGTLNFTQTSAATRSLNNLTLSINTASASLGTALDVYGNIDLNDGALNMAGMAVTLKSDPTHTATIDQLLADGSNLTGATNVTAERFIKLRGTANGTGTSNGGRAYRVLGSTVTTSTPINTNWQNGEVNTTIGVNVNASPGYGTQITGTGGSGNGFDITASNAASLFTFTPGINIVGNINYPAVTNTNVTTLNAQTGYFLYLRGDRGTSMTEPYNVAGGMSTSSTTLRATGAVQKGAINYTISNTPAAFTLITNPYPAPLDWDAVYAANSANITAFYTFWNSNTGIEGAFEVVPLASPTRRYIQPGQGFFVESTGGTTTVTINENMKAVGNNNNGVFFTNTTYESFNVELYLTEANGNRHTADAVQVKYDNNASAGPDAGDANEINNWKENIAISRNATRLAFESRPVIMTKDTIPLFMNKMRQAGYELVFTPSMFSNTALKAELVDKFLNTRTLLSVIDSVAVPFTITSDPASAATDRFMIVFGQFGPLAIDVITISAQQKNNGVQVDWTAKTEKDMDRYEVERSADGVQFNKLSTTSAMGNSPAPVNYGWFDAAPFAGNNFYRIKAFDKSGLIKYTNIVKVTIGKGAPVITVYPNPITGNTVGVKLTGLEKGTYTVSLVNNLGQRVYTGQLQHGGGTALRTIDLGIKIANGNYTLTVTGNNGIQFTEQIIKN